MKYVHLIYLFTVSRFSVHEMRAGERGGFKWTEVKWMEVRVGGGGIIGRSFMKESRFIVPSEN